MALKTRLQRHQKERRRLWAAALMQQCWRPSETHLGRQPDRACCRGTVHQQNITAGEVLQPQQPSPVVPQPHLPTVIRPACVPEMQQCLTAAHLPAGG